MIKRFTYYTSPLGIVTIQGCDDGLLGVWFETHTTKPEELGVQDDAFALFAETKRQLDGYFSGKLNNFSIPVAAEGTPFQQSVWQALMRIPFGETWSYQQLADEIGNPKAVRAVGLANGKNPVSIIVPCHRVIGKNGKLTGYAGGVERKSALLKLESDLSIS
ncbi:methylated-DNA--[protein]-cysteine S-methyltransferase [Vibrio sp. D404a]|uniref:methylated-DNA--[protein]-cysteine S-methyltransferase n=2 Tax=Vibrio TaxID=662 RepID=UPI0025552992|nr:MULTISPECIES: methylated-DNA--[protein]-cysteine S-methyltransferase [unclassified Vibrio]MDK9738736.1 methylated-DNA--[protein]-cysteine S-methyltransferase [Vibrio sp. D404a]MDK9798489.1 methylated-DNA--[protein]-cysteine S-methyltransferase [Vibrio sp. D449a]